MFHTADGEIDFAQGRQFYPPQCKLSACPGATKGPVYVCTKDLYVCWKVLVLGDERLSVFLVCAFVIC